MAQGKARERKLAVLLHADVAGSTKLVQRNESIAHARITNAFNRFSAVIESYGGIVHEVRGDALVAEFQRASDAVGASIAFQDANGQNNRQHGDGISPEIRVGISLGEVVIADSTVTGPGIVLAQRVEQLAALGGVCLTGAVHEAIPGRMPFAYTDLGEQSAKGFDDPVRVYAVELKAGEGIPPPDAPVVKASRRHHAWIASAAILTLVVAGAMASMNWWQDVGVADSEPSSHALPDTPSIAVLPFTNIGDDPEQEYFADGMTEDLITDLSKLSGLFVIARNSTFAYKGKAVDVRAVAKDLGVRYVLEGSARRAGDRTRINAQLLDATTGVHLWSERYDREVGDIFALQDEVTQRIVAALHVKLSEQEGRALVHAPTDNIEAYDHYLRGSQFISRATKESMVSARQMFKRALELDPNYAGAYASMGSTHWFDWIFQWRKGPESLMRSFELAQKALALDDSLAMAHRNMGQVLIWQKRNEDAIAAVERAIGLEPNQAYSHTWLAFVLNFSGRPAEAIESVQKAMRLNPKDPFFQLFTLGFAYSLTGQYDEAIATLKRSMSRHPQFLPNHTELTFAYAQLGRSKEAKAQAAEILRLNPKFSLETWAKRLPFNDPSVLEGHVNALRDAGLK